MTMILEIYATTIIISNLYFMYILKKFPSLEKMRMKLKKYPKVSIIVPVRHEEDTIEECLKSLINTSYPNKEIIVVEGNSTDKTLSLIKKFAKKIKIIKEKPLPKNWIGKNWACHLGYKKSKGELLLFTDGDAIHKKDCLTKAVNYLEKNNVDMLTLFTQISARSFWEKIVMPTIINFILLYNGGQKVNDDNCKNSTGNGQFLLIRRNVYEKIGGHKKIKNEILEDSKLAKLVKEHKFRLRVLWGEKNVKTKSYLNFSELWNGWTRNIYSISKDLKLFVLSILGVTIFFLLPYIIFLYGILFFDPLKVNDFLFFGFLMSSIQYIRMKFFYKKIGVKILYVLFFPISLLIFLGILINSFYRNVTKKGVLWKNRLYK